jgi:tRNA(Ile)-lysidine synthase
MMKTIQPILAISGGPDSVFLLHQLLKECSSPILAHFNHKLRGKESDKDEAFVKALAERHGLTFECESAASPPKNEETARNLRYEFLEKIRQKHGGDEIYTAHHLNDNLETVLMNERRGCQLKGKIGMQEKRDHLVRPLLNTPKSEILNFLQTNKIPYRLDASNKDTKFTRNWVRHILIPQLLEENPSLLKNFQKERASALAQYKGLKQWAITQTFPMKVSDFLSYPTFKQQFLLQHLYEEHYGSTLNLTTAQIKSVQQLITQNKTGKQRAFGPTLTIHIQYGDIHLQTKSETPPLPTLTSTRLHHLPKSFKSATRLYIDADKIPNQKLHLRTWEKGDRFQPSGMSGTKKLQDYFTDKKIPKSERHHIPILTTEDNQIVAVGHRLDEKFSPQKNTQNILSVNLK